MKKTKMRIATIGLVLMLSFAASLVVLTTVSAQDVSEIETLIYVAPQPVTGVGQQMFIVYWTDKMPDPATDEEVAAGKRGGWYGVTLTITKPDNSEVIVDMPKSDPVGGGYTLYTPDQIGDYSVKAYSSIAPNFQLHSRLCYSYFCRTAEALALQTKIKLKIR